MQETRMEVKLVVKDVVRDAEEEQGVLFLIFEWIF